MVTVTLSTQNKDKQTAKYVLRVKPPVERTASGALKRRYYLPGTFFLSPKSDADRVHNRIALKTAENARADLEMRLNESELYTSVQLEAKRKMEQAKVDFYDYAKTVPTTDKNIVHALKRLKDFAPSLTFGDITPDFGQRFKAHLANYKTPRTGKSLSSSAQHTYFNKVKFITKTAHKRGDQYSDPLASVKSPKAESKLREFLTEDEVRQLAATPAPNERLRQMALFTILTGIAWADLVKLEWDQIRDMGTHYEVRFNRSKTGAANALPIPTKAVQLLGEPSEGRIFEHASYSGHMLAQLQQWVLMAGIKKKITYHCLRHTYAVLALSKGIAITTVSKNLGHKSLETTLIYAKVVDELRQDAAKVMDDLI